MSFKAIFKQKPEIIQSAHARVNLIGEHTDYTGGFVLPTLLKFKTTIEIAANSEKKYQVYSEHFKEKKTFNDFIKSKNNDWIDYIKGCLFVFYNELKYISNKHLNIYISSDIPIERGISSSSALCVGVIKSLNEFFKTQISDKHIAILAQKVERDYIGVSGGIMDQMVSSIGIHRKAFFLDCLNLKYQLLDIPQNWKFYLVDSAVQRNLRNSSYNERYSQLKKAEKELSVEYLGSIKLENYMKEKISDPIIRQRASHVITENDRVLKSIQYMRKKNIKEFGNLMIQSHISYSNDFEASTKDVDLIVKNSIKAGANGARLTGGGFGGFTVSLIEENKLNKWLKQMSNIYDINNILEA
tara:strand:- start:1667 stop:2734 length:1068 start_codon:yes stop_codon:yes gene_type:complete